MSNARDKANIPSLNFSSTGIDDNATSTAITIDDVDKVKIGTTTDAWSGSNSLVIKEASGDGITIVSASTTNNGNIGFSDTEGTSFSNMRGLITYLHNGDSMRFMTANAERMRLNSTGLGIGTSSLSGLLSLNATTPNIDFLSGGTGKATITSGSGGALAFYTGGVLSGSGSERMRIDSSGRVGIGETDNSTYTLGKKLVIGELGNNDGITLKSATNSSANYLSFGDSDSGDASFRGYIGYRHADNNLVFGSNSLERMRINPSGNVGIGTSSPTGKLNIATAATDGVNTLFGANVSPTAAGMYVGFNDSDATATLGVYYSANPYPIINITRSDRTIKFMNDATERMRIDSSGSVFFNTNGNSVSSSQPGASFTKDTTGSNAGKVSLQLGTPVTGGDTMVQFINSNGQVGYISVSGTSTAYNTSSDYRLKENINYNFDATTRLKQLKPARFNFIADADTTVDGFIAHEVSDIVPEAISGEKDAVKEDGTPEYQGIDQAKLVPLLVKTIQELEARITTLEANNP